MADCSIKGLNETTHIELIKTKQPSMLISENITTKLRLLISKRSYENAQTCVDTATSNLINQHGNGIQRFASVPVNTHFAHFRFQAHTIATKLHNFCFCTSSIG